MAKKETPLFDTLKRRYVPIFQQENQGFKENRNKIGPEVARKGDYLDKLFKEVDKVERIAKAQTLDIGKCRRIKSVKEKVIDTTGIESLLGRISNMMAAKVMVPEKNNEKLQDTELNQVGLIQREIGCQKTLNCDVDYKLKYEECMEALKVKENSLSHLENKLQKSQLDVRRDVMVNEQLSHKEEELYIALKKNDSLTNKLRKSEKFIKSCKSENERLQNTSDAMTKDLNEMQKKLEASETKSSDLKNEIKKSQISLTELQEKNRVIDRSLHERKQLEDELRNQIHSLEVLLTKASYELDSNSKREEYLKRQSTSLQETVQKEVFQNARLENIATVAKNELELCRKKNLDLDKELNEVKGSLVASESARQEISREKVKIVAELEKLDLTREELEQRLAKFGNMKLENVSLEAFVAESRCQTDSLRNEKEQLKVDLFRTKSDHEKQKKDLESNLRIKSAMLSDQNESIRKLKELVAKLEKQEKEKDSDLYRKLKKTQEANRDALDTIDEQEKLITNYEKEIREFDQKIAAMEQMRNMISHCEKEITLLKTSLESSKTELERVKQRELSLATEYKALRKQLKKAEANSQKITQRYEDAKLVEENLRQELSVVEKIGAEKNAQINNLLASEKLMKKELLQKSQEAVDLHSNLTKAEAECRALVHVIETDRAKNKDTVKKMQDLFESMNLK